MTSGSGYKVIFGLSITVIAFSVAIKATATKSDIGSKKILVLLPVPTPSHQNLFSVFINGLLDRGHYVTFVTSRGQNLKHPRLREVLVENPMGTLITDMGPGLFRSWINGYVVKSLMAITLGPAFNQVVFENPEVLALKHEKFDLVITEAFLLQEPLLGFAHHYGCPSLALQPLGYAHHLNHLTGGATNPAYVPNVFAAGADPETFLDRFKNTISSVFMMISYHLFYLPLADAQMRTVFPDAPRIQELLKNISLTLITNNNALTKAVPLAPSVIEVAGIHIKPGKPLPADLKKWIEDSQDGIVYFSLGSLLRANFLPDEKREAIFASFGKLKQRVLVKWNGDIPSNAPKNCRFEEWVPQQEVLAHPKLKVFVTHGGLLSTQESVYFGAAIIGMPVLGDQIMNMETANKLGFALTVSVYELTTEVLDAALNEVISNPKYRARSKELSLIFRLDPMPALEKAVHYTEQLIKLGSFKHLQPSSVNLHWYQYMLLDVLAVIAVVLYLAWRIVRCVCGTLVGYCCKSTKAKKD